MNEGNTDIETGKPGTDPAGTAETGTDSGKETPKAGTQAPAAMTPETVTALVQKMLQDFTAKQQAQQSEAEKLAGMNGTQRLEYERDSYKDQLAQLQKQMNLAQMQDTARGMLAEKNIHAAEGLLAAIVNIVNKTDRRREKDQKSSSN